MEAQLTDETFRKTATCPASELLLAYRRHQLAIRELLEIELHLRGCDFCSAELQLLSRHRPLADSSAAEEIPIRLRRLADQLFVRPAATFGRREIFNHRLSH